MKRDGAWTFFSNKEQRLTEGLVGTAIFSSVKWSQQCLPPRSTGWLGWRGREGSVNVCEGASSLWKGEEAIPAHDQSRVISD